MDDVVLAFHQLSFVPEGAEVVVGRPDTGSFAVLPADGAELIHRMSEGMTTECAAQWYRDTYDQAVDLQDFIDGLTELGFLRSAEAPPVVPPRLRHRRLANAVFSPATAAAGLVLVISWLGLLLTHRDLRPASSQIFFTGSLLLIQTVITFGQVPLLFLHEGAHILAGQRLGLSSKLSISNRLTYIVFETQLNGLLSVPRRRRYLPFLAGMLVDVVVLAGFGVIAQLTRSADGSLSEPARLCLCLAFTVLMRLVWQFQLHLRTDLYFVFATALNCFDLHEASKGLLKNRVWRALNQPQRLLDEQQWTELDRQVGRWYGPFVLLGMATTLAILFFASLPIMSEYFGTIWRNLSSGRIDGPFWDSTFSLGFNVAQIIALVLLSHRKRGQAANRAPRLLVS